MWRHSKFKVKVTLPFNPENSKTAACLDNLLRALKASIQNGKGDGYKFKKTFERRVIYLIVYA